MNFWDYKKYPQIKKTRTKKTVKIFLTILIFFISSFCAGCNKIQKDVIIENTQITAKQKKLKDYLFKNICSILNNKKIKDENDGFFYLKKILSYQYFDQDGFFYYFEKYFPDYVSIYECSRFYSESFETADWVDSLILKIEEERIANEIAEMETEALSDLENEEDSVIEEILDEQNEQIEKIFSDSVEQKEISSKNGNLIFMEFDQEKFIPKKTETGYEIIHSQNNNVTRNYYNQKFLLESSQKWVIDPSKIQENQNPVSIENYFYDNETSTIIKIEKITFDENIQNLQIVLYDDKKQIVQKSEYKIIDEKRYLIQQNDFKYDKNGNIVQNEKNEYFYNDDFSVLTEQFSRKYVYKMNDEDFPPDFEYFENDVLKMKNKYSSQKGSYTSQIFFEDDFSVKTYYIEEKKVKEIYYSGESVLRVKNYDKQ